MYIKRISFICLFTILLTFLNISPYNYAVAIPNAEPGNFIVSIYLHSAIAYNAKIFVVVGENGNIFTSEDCVKWTKSISGTIYNLNSIVWNGSRFVAVGDCGAALTSIDGKKWSPVDMGIDENLGSVIWGNNEFVAVGENGSILASSDALNWSNRKYGRNMDFRRIIWTGSQYVIVGEDRSNQFSGVVLASQDGKAWRETSMYPYTSLVDITWDGKEYIGVENQGYVWQSVDLSNWMKTTYETAGDMGSIVWNGKQFVIAAAGVMITSNDGYSWVEHKYDISDFIQSIVWTGDKYVAVGIYGHVLTSKEGLNWSSSQETIPQSAASAGQNSTPSIASIPSPIKAPDSTANLPKGSINYKKCSWVIKDETLDANIAGIAYGKGMYVIADQDGFIRTSKKLTTWKKSLTSKTSFRGIIFGNNIFVAYGDTAIYYSNDALNWKRSNFQPDRKLNGLVWNGKKFICIGKNGLIAYSSDCISWVEGKAITDSDLTCVYSNGKKTVLFGCDKNKGNIIINMDETGKVTFGSFTKILVTDPLILGSKCYTAITYGNGRYVAVGENGKIAMSMDGLNWSEQKSGYSNTFNGVTFNGEYFATVGSWGGTLLISQDGIDWDPIYYLGNIKYYLKNIQFINNHFCIVGDGGAIYTSYSDDLSVWNQMNLGLDFEDIAYGNGRFVAFTREVQFRSKIYTSENGEDWRITFDSKDHDLNDITWNGKMFVCVGFDGIVLSSKDGIKWTTINTGYKVIFNSILFTNGKFLAIANSYLESSNKVYESKDSIHWKSVSSIPGVGTSVQSVASNGKGYIVGNSSGKIYSSDDLKKWKKVNEMPGYDILDILWAKDYYVLVCYSSSSSDSRIYVSKDGQTWKNTLSVPDVVTKVSVCNDNVFVTGNYGAAYVSDNKLDWYKCKTNSINYLSGCVTNGKKTFLYGENGTIIFAR